jgi:hypothetical protein
MVLILGGGAWIDYSIQTGRSYLANAVHAGHVDQLGPRTGPTTDVTPDWIDCSASLSVRQFSACSSSLAIASETNNFGDTELPPIEEARLLR